MKREYNRIIPTGLKGNASLEVIQSVLGQLSDGIWENSRAMEKYWKNFNVVKNEEQDGEIDICVNDESFCYESYGHSTENPFYGLMSKDILNWLATKVKQVVKREEKDNKEYHTNAPEKLWDRTNNEYELQYMGGHTQKVHPADAYHVYDVLKGRTIKVK